MIARCLYELLISEAPHALSRAGGHIIVDILRLRVSSRVGMQQRIALVVVARSPIERLLAFKQLRGWRHLALYSDTQGDYTRAYLSADDADAPGFTVFTRRDGSIRHFWSGEMDAQSADPGQDPRGAPDLMPLWTILDCTPEGRGRDWYPQLSYPA